jgi:hypothetical protein
VDVFAIGNPPISQNPPELLQTPRCNVRAGGPAATERMDVRVRRLLIGLLLALAMAVGLKLHGSSIAMWKEVLDDTEAPSGLLFSTPKFVRTDEWLGWTPSLLSQALHRPSFPLENPNLGAGKTPLLISLPARHYSMLFRPQLYGFFLFDLETAFAWFWNVKLFGLFISFFLLLRVLTRNNFSISLFGAAWMCLSAYTQWWFSCPPMLPEMLACWATAILCTIHLFRSDTLTSIILTSAVLVIAAIDYALCFYPPFQVPLTYLGVALAVTWLWQNRKFNQRSRRGFLAIGVAGIVIAVVITSYVIECRSTIELVRQTRYPGLRQSSGGDLSLKDTLNGLAGFFNSSEQEYLASRGNASEASNFYPLWILAIAMSGSAIWQERRKRCTELVLLCALVFLTLYACCPFPQSLCRWSLLDYVTGARVLLPIGVAGILLTTILMASSLPTVGISKGVFISATAIAGDGFLLLVLRPGNQEFLTAPRLCLLIILNTVLVSLYCFAPTKLFCAAFILCLGLNNASVNPLARGLAPLLNAAPSRAIRSLIAQEPSAKWVVYTNVELAQFLKAQGADVLSGLHYVPDLKFCRELDPTGQDEAVYNRYGFANFTLEGESHRFLTVAPPLYSVAISPIDPVLLASGVHFAVFPQQFDFSPSTGMRLRMSFPRNKIWIYELPYTQR